MRLAKQLISQGYSNKAAAAEVKFATESHLCREFKKVFGTSPQTFAPARGGTVRSVPTHRISKRSWHALRGETGRGNEGEQERRQRELTIELSQKNGADFALIVEFRQRCRL